jgi:endoglucanase
MRFLPDTKLRRRAALGLACILPAQGRATAGRQDAFRTEWGAFAERYMARDGRGVDNAKGANPIPMGTALLFAEQAGDRAAFDRILSWTEGTLWRRADALHSWRYRPGVTRLARLG